MIQSVSSSPFVSLSLNSGNGQNRFEGAAESRPNPSSTQTAAEEGKSAPKDSSAKFANPKELTQDEQRQIDDLKRRDAEVRAHEMAHLAAAGSLAMGGPNYVFQTGPDGKQYAIGGDVKIDTARGRTPEETIRKARQIRAAALAPSDPSPQDLKVASAAATMETEANNKLKENRGDGASDPSSPPADAQTSEITSARRLFGNPERPEGLETFQPSAGEPQRNAYTSRIADLYQSR